MEKFSPDSWVVRYDILDKSNGHKYISSLYWVFCTVTTVGYGDILAETMMEKSFNIVVILFGVAFFSFIISSLSTIFGSMDTKEAALNNKV